MVTQAAKRTHIDSKGVEEGALLRVVKVFVQLLFPDDAAGTLLVEKEGEE